MSYSSECSVHLDQNTLPLLARSCPSCVAPASIEEVKQKVVDANDSGPRRLDILSRTAS